MTFKSLLAVFNSAPTNSSPERDSDNIDAIDVSFSAQAISGVGVSQESINTRFLLMSQAH